MKITKKIAGIAAAAMICVNALTGANTSLIADAESYSDTMKYGDYLSYTQVDTNQDGIYDYIEISGCDKSATDVTVPEKIDGLPVRSLKSAAFFNCGDLTKLNLPEGLVSIDDNAFVKVRHLTSIEIPDSVTSMGRFVFQTCSFLTNVKLSEGLTKIEEGTFIDCRSLSSVSIPKSVTALGKSAFWGCAELKDISLPNGVKSIEEGAFGNSGLTSIKIENPECEIYDAENVFPKNAVIYGYEGSTAYTYSLKYGRSFVSLNSSTVITTPAVTTQPIVTTTTVSSSYYEVTSTSGSSTVQKTTSSSKETTTDITDIPVFTEVTTITWVTEVSTQRPIAGYLLTEVSCEASADNIVMDSADTPATIMLKLLSDNGVEAVVYPELPDGFYINTVFGKNGDSIVYNSVQNSFVMTDDCAYVDICAYKPVDPGKYKIEFNIKQAKSVENSYHNGGIYYVYKYTVTGGEFIVPDENAVPGDINGDGETTIADLVAMQKYLSNLKTITKEILEKLDVNNDGKFNVFDMIILKRKIINASN